jgi:hypothetical protein
MNDRPARRVPLRSATIALAAASLLAFAAAFLAQSLASGSDREFDRLTALSNIFAFVLAALSASFAMVRAVQTKTAGTAPPTDHLAGIDSPSSGSGQADKVVRALAAAVQHQWTQEAAARGLQQPEPLNVRWSVSRRPAAHPSAILADATLRRFPVRLRLRGDVREIVAQYRALPRGQLVILGEPGAGKSVLAVLFVLDFLKQRAAGDAVPVLLYLPTWRPDKEHLHDWIARRLIEDYPFLRDVTRADRGLVAHLIVAHRILPVLDGLDELPSALHPVAIDHLDRNVADGPLIVTCRSNEYEEAVERGGRVLSTAAVVEIEPIALDDAVSFLTATGPPAVRRWEPVIRHVRANPDSPPARSLASPLIVSLARAVFTAPSTDPTELLGHSHPVDIENYLLDGFVSAAYRDIPRPVGGPGRTVRNYTAAQARRWLVFLATRMHEHGTRDLAWWELSRALPRRSSSLVIGTVVGLIFGTTGVMAGGYVAAALYGSAYGLSFAAAATISFALGPRRGPARVDVRIRGTARSFLERFVIGMAVGVALGLAVGLSAGWPFLVGLTFGLALGSFAWLEGPTDPHAVPNPRALLVQDRTATVTLGLLVGLALGAAGGLVVGAATDLAFGAFGGWSGVLAVTPVCAAVGAVVGGLAYRRVGAWSYGAAGAVMGLSIFGPANGIILGSTVGTIFGITLGLAVALAVILSRAWGAFVFSRLWFAFRGQLPWRLFRFLTDAHNRGILRQNGGTYQFRHARLQDRLARPR